MRTSQLRVRTSRARPVATYCPCSTLLTRTGAHGATTRTSRCVALRSVTAKAAATVAPTTDTLSNVQEDNVFTDAANTTRDDLAAADDQRTFVWARNWYPVAPETYLDKERPSSHTVLGEKLAIWYRAADKTWHAFKDACPHRLAALSEGRIANGNLVCSYHGWTFGPGGACNKIPQLDGSGQARACSNPRTCATSYPVMVHGGLVYVWMDPSPDGLLESKTRGPPDLGSADSGSWVTMEWPNDWRFWMEQAMDPSHANFLHTGAFKSESVIPMTPYNTPNVHPTEGFVYAHGGYEKKNASMYATRHFIPPGNIICTYRQDTFSMTLYTLLTPVSPGVTRSNWRIEILAAGADTEQVTDVVRGTKQAAPPRPATATADKPAPATAGGKESKQPESKGKVPGLLSLFIAASKVLPHWMRMTYGLGDQDAVALYYQGRNMDVRRLTDKDYVMPAVGADLGVAAINRWMRMVGYPRSLYNTSSVSEELSLEQILDRNRLHVRFCTNCQQGLRTMTRVCWMMSLASAACAVFAISSAAAALINTGAIAAAGWPAGVAAVLAPVLGALTASIWAFREDRFINGLHTWKRKGGLSLVPRK